jgi:hypothetical protein
MSTRATILVHAEQGKEFCRLYHHCDGYPEGVGNDLQNYLKQYAKDESADIETVVNELIKNKQDAGYEFTTCIHGDEEFFYDINCDTLNLTCCDRDKAVVEIPINVANK